MEENVGVGLAKGVVEACKHTVIAQDLEICCDVLLCFVRIKSLKYSRRHL